MEDDIIWDEEIDESVLDDGIVWDEEVDETVVRKKKKREKGRPYDSVLPESDNPAKFLGRQWETLKEAGSEIADTATRGAPQRRGTENTFLTGLEDYVDILGTGAKAVGDIAGDTIISAGKAVLPRSVEDAISSGVGTAAEAVVESAPGQAVAGGLEQWREASPRTYEATKNVANVAATLVPYAKSARLPKARFGDEAIENLGKGDAARRTASVTDELRPAKGENLSQWRQNAKGKDVYKPNEYELSVIKEVDELDNFNPGSSNLKKVNVIEDKVDELAKTLDDDLAASGVRVKGDYLNRRLAKMKSDISEEVLLSGNTEAMVGKSMDKLDNILNGYMKADGTIDAADLLKARRDFDKWIKKQNANVFDPDKLSATQLSSKGMRDVVNDVVNEVAPSAKVSDSLGKQSRLLKARDQYGARVAGEADTRLGRLTQEATAGGGLPRTGHAISAGVQDTLAVAITAAIASLRLGAKGAGKAGRLAKANAQKVLQEAINKGAPPAQIAALQAALEEEDNAQR